MMRFRSAALAFAVMLPSAGLAQTMTEGTGAPTDAAGMAQMHAKMMAPEGMAAMTDAMAGAPDAKALQQGGQAAFAAIQEIVTQLAADPKTDWSKVNIEALRQHLIDMDNVTLHAVVTSAPLPTGARFEAGSDDPVVRASIQRMVMAHAATMNGANGWTLAAKITGTGADLTVTGAAKDAAMIQGPGFIGVLTLGSHHQAHHLMLALGLDPHGP